ncbi:hypothetical protein SAMN06264348_10150 [Oceanospirillum linum]|nr:hypothetical protein SAMN04489856_10149 [Oleiphilus messinensis]SMP00500.1 hypothetical protein SAMN06264348_10150 [Oceanospirillum linum]
MINLVNHKKTELIEFGFFCLTLWHVRLNLQDKPLPEWR